MIRATRQSGSRGAPSALNDHEGAMERQSLRDGRSLALITGASSGIGAAIAKELSSRGKDLIVVARSGDGLELLKAECATRVLTQTADLSNDEDVAHVERLIAEHRPQLLVNCAATGRYGTLDQQSQDDLTATVHVNVLAPIRLARAAIRAGVEGIINVSSTASGAVAPDLAPYVASKAFLDSWSASLSTQSNEGGPSPLVTLVRPGYTDTGMHARLGADVSQVPTRLWSDAHEVARRALDAHAAGHTLVTIDRGRKARYLPRRVAGRLWRGGRVLARRSLAVWPRR